MDDDDRLSALVSPADWKNPTPKPRYHWVVVGGGTTGLVAAAGAAGLGARVALIERHRLGGDCLNTGCVPSKALLASAHRIAAVRAAADVGVSSSLEAVDFGTIMQRMRRLRADIAPHDSAQRFQQLGVDVFFEAAKFIDGRTIDVGNTKLRFDRALIATGARAALPPIPGLADCQPLTNESLFELHTLPARLLVLGGGPIGCEMAQCFARFGSKVTLIEKGDRILPRETPYASQVLQRALEKDGVLLELNANVISMSRQQNQTTVVIERQGARSERQGDQVLVALGRAPNVESLELERAGVRSDPRQGVIVNDRLRTDNPRVYAAGDVASRFQFTHAADFQARIAIQNALFFGRRRLSQLVIPWCTYTDPEIARVGINPQQAQAEGIPISTFTIDFASVDRAILEGDSQGIAEIYCRQGTDRIVGATIVGAHAGELIPEVVLAMNQRIGLGKLANSIHCYPTRAEAIRRLGDQYNRTRLKPWVRRLLSLRFR